MITEDQVTAHWEYVKGRLREEWGELTDDDIERSKGDLQQLVATIQERTHETKREIEDKLEDLAVESASFTEKASVAAREYADQASQALQEVFDGLTNNVRERLEQAEELVRQRPRESALVTFGTGLIAGAILGLAIRGR